MSARCMRGEFLLLTALVGCSPAAAAPPAEGTVRVAAVQYTGARPQDVDAACHDANCAVEALVRRAADTGAMLVVTPEYGLAQFEAEPVPALGEAPGSAEGAPLQERFADLADELDIYLAINLETQRDTEYFNSMIAFDPDGHVVGLHHKFELFAGEREKLSRGRDVSVFETPFGTVGLLVCADLYGAPRFHHRLVVELEADIIAWGAMWTAPGASRWQQAFARDWGVHLVGANGSAGTGHGSGIFTSSGDSLALSADGKTGILVADLPRAARAPARLPRP